VKRPIQVQSSQSVTSGEEWLDQDVPQGSNRGDKMGRPDLDRAFHFGRVADQGAVAGMGVGLMLMLQPWWDGGLRAGFFVTLAGIVAQTVTGHLQAPASKPRSPNQPTDAGFAAAERAP
jgi:hypothetical protein